MRRAAGPPHAPAGLRPALMSWRVKSGPGCGKGVLALMNQCPRSSQGEVLASPLRSQQSKRAPQPTVLWSGVAVSRLMDHPKMSSHSWPVRHIWLAFTWN